MDDQRFVDVHLEITAGTAETHRYVVRHYLNGYHREGFGLSRVYLTRHNRGPWFVFRNVQFGKSCSRSARHEPDVICDFVK